MAFPFRQPRLARNASFAASTLAKETQLLDHSILARINSVLRRRLADRVEALFQTSCASGDLETADEVLVVLANMQERERRKFGGERRVSSDPVAKAREELGSSRATYRRSSR
jgi:hypothetical protein